MERYKGGMDTLLLGTAVEAIVDRVPFDMVDDWQECGEHVMRERLSHMPEPFAEATQRYSSDPRDYLISTVLRHCANSKSRDRNLQIERSQYMITVAEHINEHLGTLLAAECGILLRCFSKLEYRNYVLQKALIERILHRGQLFSPYASVSAVVTLGDGLSSGPSSLWISNISDTNRLLRRLIALIKVNIDKFKLSTLSRLTNAISRLNSDVSDLLVCIKNNVVEERLSEDLVNEWTEEVVHFIANGFSRKGLLDKVLFDFLRDRILESCPSYSVDTLVSLCNAFSKFGSAYDVGYVELFSSLGDEIVVQRRNLTNRHVCVVSNAFAMSCIFHETLLQVLDETFVFAIDQYDGRQIAMMIHAFNKLGYRSSNREFIWRTCTKHLESYNWQGLSMVLHAYTKGELRDEATTNKFCHRLEELFDNLESSDGVISNSVDVPQPTTYVSLVYSLVKGNIFHCKTLYRYLAKGCLSNIGSYEPDEIANIAVAFSKIYRLEMASSSQDSVLTSLTREILEGISHRIADPAVSFTAFSMAKVIESLGDAGVPQSAHAILGLIKRNILILDRLSYTHITAIIRALSTLGVHDEDVLAVLNSLKHTKRVRHDTELVAITNC
uniref:RNA-editing substrate-binding complex 6 protein domain-containing protein n=1 Tax=Babesia bovis TaxID=5865 RepID=A7AS74_BABBO|eukprot:XP_001610961.1 hypothetical protein [Babesia bovis T2Bo]